MKHNAPAMVRYTMIAQLVFPIVVGFGFVASGALGAGLFWLLIGALWGYVIYLWRPQLHLVGQLLGVAAHALNDNKHLITATVGINALMGVATLPLVVFLGFAFATGDVQSSPWAVRRDLHAQTCVDSTGNDAPCCIWMPTGGAVTYMTFASLALSWCAARPGSPSTAIFLSLSLQLRLLTPLLFALARSVRRIVFFAFEIRLFTVSHVVGRWFHLPMGQKLQGRPVWEGFKTALGPSFGTLALGSAVLTAANAVRQAAQSARNNARGGGAVQFLACLCSAIAECIAELISQLSKFATVRAALTGDAFFDAARAVTDLLARNFLDAYAVWRFPSMVLAFAMFVASGAFALVFYFGYAFSVGSVATVAATQLSEQLSAAVGVGAFVLAIVAQSLMSTIILNVVDTVRTFAACCVYLLTSVCSHRAHMHASYIKSQVYICYAMDKDRHMVTRQEVHDIFVLVAEEVCRC